MLVSLSFSPTLSGSGAHNLQGPPAALYTGMFTVQKVCYGLVSKVSVLDCW